jgi:hypothetical protein
MQVFFRPEIVIEEEGTWPKVRKDLINEEDMREKYRRQQWKAQSGISKSQKEEEIGTSGQTESSVEENSAKRQNGSNVKEKGARRQKGSCVDDGMGQSRLLKAALIQAGIARGAERIRKWEELDKNWKRDREEFCVWMRKEEEFGELENVPTFEEHEAASHGRRTHIAGPGFFQGRMFGSREEAAADEAATSEEEAAATAASEAADKEEAATAAVETAEAAAVEAADEEEHWLDANDDDEPGEN